jgi:hypothetical protein
LLFALHEFLLVMVNGSIRAPLVIAVRTRLTPIGARFIKHALSGKNERFDSTLRVRGKLPVPGRGMLPG